MNKKRLEGYLGELEKNLVDGSQKIKNDIETLKLEAEKLERDGDYGRVAEIRYGKLNEKVI